MAYRRRQGITKASIFEEEIRHPPPPSDETNDPPASPSLAAQAIRASAAHRESSLSSAYGDSAFVRDSDHRIRSEQSYQPYQPSASFKKMESPSFRKGLDKITSSLNHIGDTFEKAFEEGRTLVENKTANIIQETRKLQIRRKVNTSEVQNQNNGVQNSWQPLEPMQSSSISSTYEDELKESRNVAKATAAKAKQFLRELKTMKADLAFAKERCTQLEEENKILRESRVKGNNPADDDMIRLQLETLLAEKARLAHENSIYARENRFLREIVEYHQLTMQDVVYLNEGSEEVTEVYPISIPGVYTSLSVSPPSPRSPHSHSDISSPVTPQKGTTKNEDFLTNDIDFSLPSLNVDTTKGEDSVGRSISST